jgi:hypothetical protein
MANVGSLGQSQCNWEEVGGNLFTLFLIRSNYLARFLLN